MNVLLMVKELPLSLLLVSWFIFNVIPVLRTLFIGLIAALEEAGTINFKTMQHNGVQYLHTLM